MECGSKGGLNKNNPVARIDRPANIAIIIAAIVTAVNNIADVIARELMPMLSRLVVGKTI